MKSTAPQQATWKTSDGSPWWLRNSRFGEPNGDYRANCFMNLFSNPKSPDTLKFNDWNCNYRSRSYYCQPTKSNQYYGGQHRRRRAPPAAPRQAPAKNVAGYKRFNNFCVSSSGKDLPQSTVRAG